MCWNSGEAGPLNTRFTEYSESLTVTTDFDFIRTTWTCCLSLRLFLTLSEYIWKILLPPAALYHSFRFASVSSDHWIPLIYRFKEIKLHGEQGVGWCIDNGLIVFSWFDHQNHNLFHTSSSYLELWLQVFFLELVLMMIRRLRDDLLMYHILQKINQAGPWWTMRKQRLRRFIEL